MVNNSQPVPKVEQATSRKVVGETGRQLTERRIREQKATLKKAGLSEREIRELGPSQRAAIATGVERQIKAAEEAPLTTALPPDIGAVATIPEPSRAFRFDPTRLGEPITKPPFRFEPTRLGEIPTDPQLAARAIEARRAEAARITAERVEVSREQARREQARQLAEEVFKKATPFERALLGIRTALSPKGFELLGTVGAGLPRLPPPAVGRPVLDIELPAGIAERVTPVRPVGFEPRRPGEVIREKIAEELLIEERPPGVAIAPIGRLDILPPGLADIVRAGPLGLELRFDPGSAFERGAVEFFESPVFEIEAGALFGAAIPRLAATKFATKAVGSKVGKLLFPKVVKPVSVAAGVGITGLRLAEAEQLKLTGRPEEALGKITSFIGAAGVAGLTAKVQRGAIIRAKAKELKTGIELGEFEISPESQLGRAEAKIKILGKDLDVVASAEIKSQFQVIPPDTIGGPFPSVAEITTGTGEGFTALGKTFVFPKTTIGIRRGIATVIREAIPTKTQTILFGKGKPIGVGAAESLTVGEEDLSKSVTALISKAVKRPPTKERIISVLFKKEPPAPKIGFIKGTGLVTKPRTPEQITEQFGAAVEALKGITAKRIAGPPVTTEAIVLSGAIASFQEQETIRKAAEKIALEEEELIISPEVPRIVTFQRPVERFDALRTVGLKPAVKLKEKVVTKPTEIEIISGLERVVSRQVSATVPALLQVPVARPVSLSAQIQKQLQRQAQKQATAQKRAQALSPLTLAITPKPSAALGIPLPKRKPARRVITAKLKPPKSFDVFIKRPKKVGKGFARANKVPLPRMAALGLGMTITDKFPSRSFTLRRAKKSKFKPTKRRVKKLERAWKAKKFKFRTAKKRRNVIVEKTKFAIDSRQEKFGIPFKAVRLRRAGLLKPRKKRGRRKR